jgi:hypothetical protein
VAEGDGWKVVLIEDQHPPDEVRPKLDDFDGPGRN